MNFKPSLWHGKALQQAISELGASEKAWWAEVLHAKPDNPSSDSGTHMVEGEIRL